MDELKEIGSKLEITDNDKCGGYLIDADEKIVRGIIMSLRDKKFDGVVAVLGRSGGFNRRVVETLKIDYLVSPELGERKDSLKQRDSGLNHVVAKEMAKKGIVVVFDFDSLAEIKSKEKTLRLARIMQNVKICRRAKCGIKIWGSVDEKALKSFGTSLGMSSVQV